MHQMSFQIRVYRLIKCKQFPLDQSRYPYQTNYSPSKIVLQKCTEEPQTNPPTVTRESPSKTWLKRLFKKWGELTPSRKTNTHL